MANSISDIRNIALVGHAGAGKTLLNDPNEGLDRFMQTVKDIKLHFVTYSYSGN